MARAVFCIVRDQARAAKLVSDLKFAGFSNNDISVLLPDKGGTRDFAHEHSTKAPEGAATGAGAGVGAAVGGLTGLLVGLGIPEFEAKRYEGKIRDGNVLISVHSESAPDTRRAKDIFEAAGAENISSAGEASVEKGAQAVPERRSRSL